MEMCKTLLGFAHFHRHRRHEPKQQNRTLHLLQKPDISICYRHIFPCLCADDTAGTVPLQKCMTPRCALVEAAV